VQFGGEREQWPDSFEKFSAWWLSDPDLDMGQVFERIAPRGPQGAAVMVLVDYPESIDSDRLLSGDQGKLAAAILGAIGIDPAEAYFASLLPRHMPLPDWPALAATGLGELTLHHIVLAAPKRLITFGRNASSLLGHDPTKSTDPSRQFYHVGPSIPALAAPGLDTLMARPRGKAGLWQALLDWQSA
jgi:uracil-DNA glycosylase